MTDAGEHILEWPPRGRVVEDLCSGDEGDGEFGRGLAEHELLGALLLVSMSRADSVQPPRKRVMKARETGRGGCETDQTARALRHLLVGNERSTLRRPSMSRGEESAQISIALTVLSEQEDLVMIIEERLADERR